MEIKKKKKQGELFFKNYITFLKKKKKKIQTFLDVLKKVWRS